MDDSLCLGSRIPTERIVRALSLTVSGGGGGKTHGDIAARVDD